MTKSFYNLLTGLVLILGLACASFAGYWLKLNIIDQQEQQQFTGILISTLMFLLLQTYLITRRRATEIIEKLTQQLQKSESRFRDLFENAPLPYQSLDIEGNLLDVNQAWLDLLGYERDAVIGRFFGDFMSEASKPLVQQTFAQFKETGQVSSPLFELLHPATGSKHLIIVEGRIARDSNGAFQRTHCILMDVTKQQQAQQELQDSEQRFHLLADYAPVLIWLSGLDKKCYYFNKVWLDFTGRTLAQESGDGWTEGVHPDDMEHCLNTYITAFDANLPFKMEYRLRRHDGQYRWLLDTGVPRFDDDNCFLGYIGSCIDISERYQMEKNIRQVNADLQQFARIATHHLQEPARRLASFVQRLQMQLREIDKLNEDIETSLDFINQSATRQRALVRDIQLYLAAVQPRALRERIVVRDIIAKVLASKAQLIDDKAATIEYDDLPSVYLDRPRLYDIFTILLDNALRYGNKPNLHITIRGEHIEDRVHYLIADNGVGIAEEYRELVFGVFERLQVTNDQNSTGVGLSIVKRIVESCGGSIALSETANGGGLTVSFDLPESPAAQAINDFFTLNE